MSISAQSAASTPPAARADGDHGLALVVLPGQQRPDLHGFDVLAQLDAFGIRLGHHRVVFAFFGKLVKHRQIVEATPQLLDPAQLTLRVRELTRHLLAAGLVVPQVGVGGGLLQRLDPGTQAVDVEHPLHRGEGRVEVSDVGLAVQIHNSSGYRSYARSHVRLTAMCRSPACHG